MDAYFSKEMLNFMLDISFNNNKIFMDANKDAYNRLMKQPFYRLIERLSPTMLMIDPEMEVRPSRALSRIFRDTRFSRDKSPYRNHHWIAFKRSGVPREESVTYWFEIRLDTISWGVGYWGENRQAMDMLRQRMVAKPEEFIRLLPILEQGSFTLSGESYQRRKIPAEVPDALHNWYIKKSLYFTRQGIDPNIIFTPYLADTLSEDFITLAPLYRLLLGLEDFER